MPLVHWEIAQPIEKVHLATHALRVLVVPRSMLVSALATAWLQVTGLKQRGRMVNIHIQHKAAFWIQLTVYSRWP